MSKFRFNITEEYRILAKFHFVSLEEDYLRLSESEYNLFKEYIPKYIGTVLELGCGLGRMSIYIHNKIKDNSIHYILADSTQNMTKRLGKGRWKAEEGFYNDLILTSKFCKSHGLVNFKTFDLRHNDIIKLENIDLIISFLSVGFHYKIETYLKKLLEISSKDCVMIFGIRRNQYSKNSFNKYFEETIIKSNYSEFKGKRIKEDIMILRGKK